MFTYTARRFIQGLFVLLAVSMTCFVIFRYLGDPVVSMSGLYATFEQQEEVRKMLGLDQAHLCAVRPVHLGVSCTATSASPT